MAVPAQIGTTHRTGRSTSTHSFTRLVVCVLGIVKNVSPGAGRAMEDLDFGFYDRDEVQLCLVPHLHPHSPNVDKTDEL